MNRKADLQFFELFGGTGAIAGNNCPRGQVWDVRRCSEENIHRQESLFRLAEILTRMMPGKSVVFIEPVASSWLSFVSKHTSGRSKDGCCKTHAF